MYIVLYIYFYSYIPIFTIVPLILLLYILFIFFSLPYYKVLINRDLRVNRIVNGHCKPIFSVYLMLKGI